MCEVQATPVPLPVQELSGGTMADAPVEGLASCAQHSAVIGGGRLYTFGASSFGRLGLGATTKRQGVHHLESHFFPGPSLNPSLRSMRVSHVACGANHTMCVCSGLVFSFGDGAGGKLGHGDNHARHVPTLVKALADIGRPVTQIVASVTFSMAIVAAPAFDDRPATRHPTVSRVLDTTRSTRGSRGQVGATPRIGLFDAIELQETQRKALGTTRRKSEEDPAERYRRPPKPLDDDDEVTVPGGDDDEADESEKAVAGAVYSWVRVNGV